MLHTHIIVFAQIYAHILPQAINAILIYCSLLSANKNHNKKHWAIIITACHKPHRGKANTKIKAEKISKGARAKVA